MKISALLLSSVSKAASVFDDFCDGRTDGLYQYPWDCEKFYNCAHGVTHIQNCETRGGHLMPPPPADCNDGFNGGCSHYCNNNMCSCPDCWSMKEDGKTCLPQSDLAEITCSPTGMSLSLHQCVLPGVSAPTLLDTDCTATLADDTFTLDTTLDGCDTAFILDDDVVTFTNYLLAPGGVTGGIMTSKPVQLEFSCDFAVGANVNLTTTGNGLFGNTSLASAPIEVTFGVGDEQPAFGAFSYTLAFYEDESFDTLMDMENKIVSVGDTIYAAVSVDVPVAGLEFTIEECVIEDPAAGMSLTMIDAQCGEPIIETSIGSYSDSEMITFSFMSFLFPSKSRNWSEQSQMQLSCSIYVCDEHDSGSLCSVDPGCGSRKRRSAEVNRSLYTNSVQFNVKQ
ncbi:Oidioi.mRNA.OKI2018_I69.PAR.g9498.t1.cds [Oikopleura dioica]|uniref:chitinase n=1 Tax=Oikopleura dioica TaxID=34765 RepID=A0ABN7RQ48_OIKDI|nr:Oidioi.mRNA.OKI2018_I69.PAR.g9498.t1.cds [Oikopleura dioica]